MALTQTVTFEEGTDGAAITTASSGAVAVSGSPLYAVAAKVHGGMGANLSGASAVVFTEPTTGGAGNGQSSTYAKLRTAGSTPTTAVGPKQASTFHARVRFNNSNGKIDVTDGPGTTVQGTSATSYTLDQWVRIDIRRTYSSPNLTITVRLFFGANLEGTVPDETLGPYTLNVGTNATARDSLGPSVTGGVLYVDTHRMYDDTTTWPAPFAPTGTASATATAATTATGSVSSSGLSGTATLAASAAVSSASQATAVATAVGASATVSAAGVVTSGASALFTATAAASGAGVVASSAGSEAQATAATSAVGAIGKVSGVAVAAAAAVTAAGSVSTPVAPQLAVNFEDGTTGAFNTVQGATVSATAAHDGNKGVRLAPDGSGFATLVYNIPSGQQTHSWAAFRGWWRPVVKTAEPSGNFGAAVLLEIYNTLTTSTQPLTGKGQMTIYTQGGDLGVDFNTTDFAPILPAYATGGWHLVEFRVFYGDTTFKAYVRIDGVEYVHTSAAGQIAASVRSLSLKYSGNVTDATDDWDSIQFWHGDADPGYLTAISPTATTPATATVTADGQVGTASGSTSSASATTAAAGTVATSSTATRTATASAAAAGMIAATANVTRTATAGTTAAGTVGTTSGSTSPATAATTAAGSVASATGAAVTAFAATVATGSVTTGDAAFTAMHADVTADGTVASTASAGLAATAAAGAAGAVTTGAAASIGASGSTTAAGTVTATASAVQTATVTTTATGLTGTPSGATIAGLATATATGVVTMTAVSVRPATVTVTAAGAVSTAGGASASVVFTATAAGFVSDGGEPLDLDGLVGSVAASPWAGTVAPNPWAGTIGEA